MSHFVIFCFDPPPPHVTYQKVTNFDGLGQMDIFFIYVFCGKSNVIRYLIQERGNKILFFNHNPYNK